jgi:hypothetical protein
MPWRRVEEWAYGSILLDLDTWWGWWVKFTRRLRYPQGNCPSESTEQGAGWAPEPIWSFWSIKQSLSLAGNWTQTVQPIVSCYSDINFTFISDEWDSISNRMRGRVKRGPSWTQWWHLSGIKPSPTRSEKSGCQEKPKISWGKFVSV